MELERKTGGYKSAGEFYVAVRKYFDGVMDGRIDTLRKAALTENSDSGGGVLVPTEWAKQIYSAALEGAIVRPRANIVRMTGDTIKIPTLVDSARSSSIYGGVTLTWGGEGADNYASTVAPTFGECTLTAKKGVASCFISRELEQDAESLGSYLTTAFGNAVRFYEDDAFIWGTGSGQPLGIMNAASLISVSRTNNMLVPSPVDVGEMASRLLPGCWSNAVWLMNQKMLYTWAAAVTTSGVNALAPIDLTEMIILGRPIIVTEHALAPGGPGDLVLADFSQYLIGDRDIYISASSHATYSTNTYGWFQDQTMWKITLRVDGQPLLPAAITAKRGGETLSPFVALTTAS